MKAALLFVLFASSSAFAGGEYYKFESQSARGMCMDAEGDHKVDGDKVMMYKCHGKENQRWTVTTDENGQSAIVGTGGFCLDVRGTHSFKDGTPVQLWKCHFGNNQRFTISGDGQIREVQSGKCLLATHEHDGASIVLDECNHWKHEKWAFNH
jgi:hypothetical protein